MKTLPVPSAAPKLNRTYWVLYGKLLAGAYAGQPDMESHLRRLQGLFDEGVRTIVNLMETHERNNNRQPFTPYEKQFQDIASRAGESITCVRFPIVDQSITTKEHMTQILDAIDDSLRQNKPVYVHCFGGIGRTGTVVCCWLLRHGYANERDVFEVLSRLRQADRERAHRQAPENDEQWQFVLDWFRQSHSKRSSVKLRNDWFTRLTGFSERSRDEIQANLSVVDGQLHSRVNGKTYACGHLDILSLGELRTQVKKQCERSDTRGKGLQLSEVVGDAKQLHGSRSSAGALFQVASQFNLLEMVSPSVTPEQGVGIYEHDATQGPACAIACGAGTIYRNYFVELDGQLGQTANKQVDCLRDVGAELGNVNGSLWKMQNGYALPSLAGLTEIDSQLGEMSESDRDELRAKLKFGIQRYSQITLPGCSHLVSQVYCSAMPVAYSNLPNQLWERFARLILEAAYEATLGAGVLNAQQTGNKSVFLTLLGGGAFGNDEAWIMDAILRACELYKSYDLDVKIVSYHRSKATIKSLVDLFSESRASTVRPLAAATVTPPHYCPSCGERQVAFMRYPWYICHDCVALATDSRGRQLEFFNAGLSGGLQWRYVGQPDDALQECNAVICMIHGRPVTVTEARFGGIVAQPNQLTGIAEMGHVINLSVD